MASHGVMMLFKLLSNAHPDIIYYIHLVSLHNNDFVVFLIVKTYLS